MTREPLTASQTRVYAFIRAYWMANTRSPSMREMAEALGFSSTNAVVVHLDRLERKGWIQPYADRTSRNIVPTGMRIVFEE